MNFRTQTKKRRKKCRGEGGGGALTSLEEEKQKGEGGGGWGRTRVPWCTTSVSQKTSERCVSGALLEEKHHRQFSFATRWFDTTAPPSCGACHGNSPNELEPPSFNGHIRALPRHNHILNGLTWGCSALWEFLRGIIYPTNKCVFLTLSTALSSQMSVQEVVQGCCTSSKHHVCVRLRDNMLLKLSKDVFFFFIWCFHFYF